MKSCNTCGGYAWECECAADNVVASYSASGLPQRADGTLITSLLTPAQRREIERRIEAQRAVPNLRVRQAS